VVTALQFEFLGHGRHIKFRRVMGGLSDRPVTEGSFFAKSWRRASEISGMPFNAEIWDHHLLRTTFEACRAVKAALPQGQNPADRLLRRIREAYYVERIPIDHRKVLLELARQEGLDVEAIRENISSGRAENLFARDRQESSQYDFGFPSLILKKSPKEATTTLLGVVTYNEVLQALYRQGLSLGDRRRFANRPEDWDRLFSIHPRLTLPEIRLLSGLSDDELAWSCARYGLQKQGVFFLRSQGRSRNMAAHSNRMVAR